MVNTTRVRSRIIAVAILAVIVLVSGRPARANDDLVLAVHPYLPYEEIEKRFTPLADYLSQKTGHKIKVRVGSNYAEHNDYIGNDKVDIAFMGPASYVDVVNKHGDKPILAKIAINGNPHFKGRIIASRDSDIERLSDAKGRYVAFGDKASTMSHLVPRYMLREAGAGIDKLGGYRFLGSHTNVALAVLSGDYDLGAVKEEVFTKYKARGLKSVAETPAISEHLFVTRTGLLEETIEALRDAMHALKDSQEGRKIMTGIKKNMTAMVPAKPGDYDNLRVILKSLSDAGIR